MNINYEESFENAPDATRLYDEVYEMSVYFERDSRRYDKAFLEESEVGAV
ncbi:MAG: hypothetical protein IJO20_05690 [Ruminococcus sp.]|nr:hypothetical protein [Ruminococcus sp.]MBQ7133971.1 hypothetical protein [Ruminococcus sp.]